MTAALRRLWPHGYFEGRIDEEAARCTRTRRSFAVLRLRVIAGSDSAVEDVLASALRPHDVLATYARGEYEALLSELDPEDASTVTTRLEEQFSLYGLVVRTGLAFFPRDASSASEVLARAHEQVRDTEAAAPIEYRGSATMRSLDALIEQVAPSTLGVLILGETGVGKEVCAERIHRRSPRANGTMLRLHCAALTESLIESELFGHERGAFTGAVGAKPGLIESADGGTVFLDEIGELPMSIQVKLLRVLDDRQTMRVGAIRSRAVDVRFISATNRDLDAEVAAGRFRKDLYYRLAGVTLEIPPLRERVSEIVPLARELAASAAKASGLSRAPELAPTTAEALERYAWPGNVRELRNIIERGVLLSRGDTLLPAHLPLDKMTATLRPAPEAVPAARHSGPSLSLVDDVATLERSRILSALESCGGNQSAAARLLRISRGKLAARLTDYGVIRPRKHGRSVL